MSTRDRGTHSALSLTIERTRLRSVFQPIVDLASAEVVGFEGLTRPDPAAGFGCAAALFDAADDAGLLDDLEAVTRPTALRDACEHLIGARIFINTSPEVIGSGGFAERLRRELSRGVLSPEDVVLEITERRGAENPHELKDQIERLRRMGVSIALDDVGAGANGLCRLLSLRPDWIKLDHSLVREVEHDKVKRSMIRSLISYAKDAGAGLVAEGIERRGELRTLIELGVPFGQGYFLGRPGPASASLRHDAALRARDACGAARAHDASSRRTAA
jgi:EAL domain-containing protein (putative c-di-GMP-specific phosphodiesterase class I)